MSSHQGSEEFERVPFSREGFLRLLEITEEQAKKLSEITALVKPEKVPFNQASFRSVRPQLSDEEFSKAVALVIEKLHFRQNQKGVHSYTSCHECSGILDEEMVEFKEEVHLKSKEGQIRELQDIAVAAIWSIASINSGKTDW